MTAPVPPAGEASVTGQPTRRVMIGILALQGAFAEHSSLLSKLGADVREVRLPHEFEGLDGIVLPGGESTAMALIGERWGVFPRLKQWVSEGRPVWGTCAGMILLSDHALMQKKGGQSLVGGLNVEICRNYFGAQTSSFEVPLDTSALATGSVGNKDGDLANKNPYPAVFIRAPAVLEAGPGVDVLCKVRSRPCNKAVTVMKAQLKEEEADDRDDDTRRAKRRRLAAFFVEPNPSSAAVAGKGGEAGSGASTGEKEAPEVIVAIRKGNIVGTAFHPELTNDSRWHEYFVRIVKEAVSAGAGGVRDAESTTKTPAGAAAAAEAEVAVA
ncbi:unnamed protein product [Ectocarpus sp. 4 AP-2014]